VLAAMRLGGRSTTNVTAGVLVAIVKRIAGTALRYARAVRLFRAYRAACRLQGCAEPLWRERRLMLRDSTRTTEIDGHYLYHPAWAARILRRIGPAEHVDFSSSLQFAAIVSAFLRVRFYDYRPAALRIPGLEVGEADLLHLPFADGALSSVSCMHVVEHIGLGRYGEPLDPVGDRKAISELKRVVAPGGTLLFVVPIGVPRVQFNAHRIYSLEQVEDAFGDMHQVESALVPDDFLGRGMLTDPPRGEFAKQRYGCGCFCFRKP
jgi:SAM-dependent methyltransferase